MLPSLACTQAPNSDDGFTSFADDDEGNDETTGDGDGDGSCGDGIVDPGEECDLGPENSDSGACTGSCTLAVCGDGVVYEQFEECDDGNASNTDDCVQDCKLATCGDGFTRVGVEACDDGNDDQTDGCTTACEPSTCGDGVVQGSEQCDDGNLDDTDACPSTCLLAFCGDGFVQAGVEECDDGNQASDDTCLAVFCVPATCGDGHIQTGVEECDDGNLEDDDLCPTSCTEAYCGDGFAQAGVEECDDGNDDDDDFCKLDCSSNGWFDNFETGDLTLLPWMTSGNANWTVSTVDAHDGIYAAASGTITHDQQSTLQVTLDVPQAGVVRFWHHVSSEEDYDYLIFYIDNVFQDEWSGALGWQQAQFPITAGNHTLRWVYDKDFSVNEYSDKAWIDEVYVGPS
ncbi:MAG TPA: DUF4215 domain-containing protein [Enhygromyxa sp.]|nr:DUF4215 domain-containing protein [Enhygromyxa sp.]